MFSDFWPDDIMLQQRHGEDVVEFRHTDDVVGLRERPGFIYILNIPG